MKLPLLFAFRYLFARKSHHVINIISGISVAGMAIGTAALIVILSVYNGFDALVRSSMSTLDPDFLITPAAGKVFVPEDHREAFDRLYDMPEIATMCTVLEESVFVSYDKRQATARAKGVDEVYEQETSLREHIRSGQFRLHRGDIPEVCVGAALAWQLGLNPRFVTPLELWYPSRKRSISLVNPAGALNCAKVYPTGTFSVNSDVDAQYIILPIEKMRELMEYENEVSGVEIRLAEAAEGSKAVSGGAVSKVDARKVGERIAAIMGDGFIVKDRYQQNESVYKMMTYEKMVIWMILLFVVLIIAFNIFGSLSMLIIEKKDDIATMRNLGMPERMIRRVFVLEGWFISLLGLAIGLILGLAVAYWQQQTGFIKMPGNFLVESYPVVIQSLDIWVTALSVALVGWLIALIPARRI
ncbi:MAG: ABC transporter permease [Bacteroidales bacterium]|nr:ABC transporter permease [Bacteroidales bacterium]